MRPSMKSALGPPSIIVTPHGALFTSSRLIVPPTTPPINARPALIPKSKRRTSPPEAGRLLGMEEIVRTWTDNVTPVPKGTVPWLEQLAEREDRRRTRGLYSPCSQSDPHDTPLIVRALGGAHLRCSNARNSNA